MDDWEADLDDLLASDDEVKPAKRKSFTPTKGKAPAKSEPVKDDSYYASLAAVAGDAELSDVSEADPVEMARQLEGLDDMDAALFGGGAKPKSTADTKGKPKPQEATAEKSSKKKENVVEDDDSLSDLLSDKQPRSVLKKSGDSERPRTGEKRNEPSNNSQRYDAERPPTRSGQNSAADAEKPAVKRRTDDVVFDDDDVLGGMGLSSPRESGSPVKGRAGSEQGRSGGARSIMDDLLGSDVTKQHLEKPGTKKEHSALDSILNKPSTSGSGKKTSEEDGGYQFGSYMPSSAGGSRPSSRRSVRFEEDDLTEVSSRPTSGPGTKVSQLEDTLTDSRDWLDIATNSPGKKPQDEHRAKSDGDVVDGQQTNANSQGGDWFGMSRIGSPDITPRDDDMEQEPTKTSAVQDTETKKPISNPDKTKTTVSPQEPSTSQVEADDSDWLDKIREKKTSMHKETPVKKSADDWLGLGDEEIVEVKPDEGRATDDYLGLGGDVDLDALINTAPRASRRSDDIFSAPPKTSLSASLPWEKPQKRDNRRATRERPGGLSATLDGHQYRPDPVNSAEPAASGAGESVHQHRLDQPAPVVSATSPGPSTGLSTGPPHTQTPVLASTSLQDMSALQNQQIQQQQELFRQQQAELQREMQMRTEQLQQQQEMQRQSIRAQQEQQIQSLMTAPINTESVLSPGVTNNKDSQMRKLEAEKQHLLMMMETLRTQHREEQKLLEDSYKKRMEFLEDSYSQREQRLREEMTMLSSQTLKRIELVEQEKADLVSSYQDRMRQVEMDRDRQLDLVRDSHRAALTALKEDHKIAIERLKLMKDREIDAVADSHDTTRCLTEVMSKVKVSASELDDLSRRVDSQHLSSMSQRESAALSRDQQLKAFQERLEREHHSNEQERARLQGLVTKLELQLTEQARHLEEEKWRMQQEENKYRTLQASLDKEKSTMMEQIQRDRSEVDRAKDELLAEQKKVLTELNSERKQLSDERAQFNLTQRLNQDQELRESVKHTLAQTELGSTVKAINDEKARLETRSQELEAAEKKMKAERDQLAAEIQAVQLEKQQLEQLAIGVRQRSLEIQDMCTAAGDVREEGQKALQVARETEAQMLQQQHKIQAELQALRSKERHIAEERVSLAREKQDMEKSRSSMLCVGCRTPVRDTNREVRMTPAAQNLLTALGSPELTPLPQAPPAQNAILKAISTSIEVDRSVRTWRIEADKDKEYLAEEGMFLEAIKHSPYHSTSAKS